nr:PAS rich protein [Talaromyces amestolkiae polymycovirus 1]
MSLSSIITEELAAKLKGLTVDDFSSIIRACSVGMTPVRLAEGVSALTEGEDYTLPDRAIQPKALTIQAYSFVRDPCQYNSTYGLDSSRAGQLLDLLRSDPTKGQEEIQTIVSAHLRRKGSKRPVIVTMAGFPSSVPVPGGTQVPAGSDKKALKAEIKNDSALYGMYRFGVIDTGRAGPERFMVKLGGGLVAFHQSSHSAVDVARITRKHGRAHPLVAAHVAQFMEGHSPRYGDSIDKKITFSGKLAPSDQPPADPVEKAKTAAA